MKKVYVLGCDVALESARLKFPDVEFVEVTEKNIPKRDIIENEPFLIKSLPVYDDPSIFYDKKPKGYQRPYKYHR